MAAFAYDLVPYETRPVRDSHPARLAAIGLLAGLEPAPVERAQVLEIGCGAGGNLLPMAYRLPQSDFVGIDLSENAIAEAEGWRRALGLRNLRFLKSDILDFSSTDEFDYILAHGFYSWVPAPARDKLLAVCGARLAPQGLAYISYNTLPGFHLRNMMRGMMLYQARDAEGPEDMLRQAGALLDFLDAARPASKALAMELETVREQKPYSLFHDDLSEVNHAVYFHEFVEHAGRFGLQFVDEAKPNEIGYPEQTLAAVRARSGGDRIREGQYFDFLKCRRFRQSVLCRADLRVRGELSAEAVESLYLIPGVHQPEEEKGPEGTFLSHTGARLITNDPLFQRAMSFLAGRGPMPLHFDAWAEASGAQGVEQRRDLAGLALQAYSAGLLEFHSHAAAISLAVSERPIACPLVRTQLEHGTDVTNLMHVGVEVGDPLGVHLLKLLDGTRDADTILHDLQEKAASGGSAIRIPREKLIGNMKLLAKMGLLVA
jgi:SAM-dependent methyltransferase